MSGQQVPAIFSMARRALRSERAASAGGTNWLYDAMQEDIAERLDFMRFDPQTALLIGAETGQLAHLVEAQGTRVRTFPELDEEQPLPVEGVELLISLARLDTVNDLPGALIHSRNALSPGGLMIAQIVGAGSLLTLRQIMLAADGDLPAARIHPQIDDRAATALLQRAGFSKQVVDTHKLTVRYSSLDRLVSDLREQALTSVLRSPAPQIGKAALARAKARFEEMRVEDGKVTETFNILTLTAWR